MNKTLCTLVVATMVAGFSSAASARPKAVFHTSMGDFTCELFPDKSPKTVENFIGLAKGTKTWTHPGTRQVMSNTPLYSGTIFHRTIPGFMIQGGCPLGTGTGDPGYRFADEVNDLKFNKPGLLAMANSGPNTNGSQFFVTVSNPDWLNGKHTIFGEVVSGMDIVEKIVTNPGDRRSGKPDKPVTLTSVEIIDDKAPASAAAPAPAAADKKTTDPK